MRKSRVWSDLISDILTPGINPITAFYYFYEKTEKESNGVICNRSFTFISNNLFEQI